METGQLKLSSRKLRGGAFSLPILLVFFVVLMSGCGSDSDQNRVASLTYDYTTIYRESEDCVSPDSICTHVIIEYPVFTSGPSEGVVEILNDSVRSMVLSCALDPEAIDSIAGIADQFIESYNQAKAEFDDNWVAWAQQISVDVKGDNAGILCLALSRYEYTGGAHPSSELTFHNFDTRTGSSVTLDEVLIAGMLDSLTILVEREFRMEHDLTTGKDLGEAGFWFDEGLFVLTKNVCIGDDGITFFYNPYEVAPYSEGPTEVSLPYKILDGVIDIEQGLSHSVPQ